MLDRRIRNICKEFANISDHMLNEFEKKDNVDFNTIPLLKIAEHHFNSINETKEEFQNSCDEIWLENVNHKKAAEIVALKAFANIYYDFDPKIEVLDVIINENDVVYVLPNIVLDYLKIVNCSLENKALFWKWYLEGLVNCYISNTHETFKNIVLLFSSDFTSTMDNSTNKMLYLERLISKNNSMPEKIKNEFIQDKMIANKMFEEKEKNGIDYYKQLTYLEEFKLCSPFAKELSKITLSEQEKKVENKKQEVPKIEKEKMTEFVQSEEHVKKTKEEKQYNNEKIELLNKMRVYFDERTLKNKTLIKDKMYEFVLEVLNRFFSSEEVAYFKRVIFCNNEMIKQEMFEKAKKELLSEENYILLQSLEDFVSNVDTSSIIYGYVPIIKSKIEQIYKDIHDYLDEEEKTKDVQIYYQELIGLNFFELQSFAPILFKELSCGNDRK